MITGMDQKNKVEIEVDWMDYINDVVFWESKDLNEVNRIVIYPTESLFVPSHTFELYETFLV